MGKFLEKVKKTNWKIYYPILFAVFMFVLSFFRAPNGDENYYLKETFLISELLKGGTWIGDYGVGLHGFLFKVPVALVYVLIGGPSVFVATTFTIILAAFCVYLFSEIAKHFFKNETLILLSILVFSTNILFFNMSLTFNRDIPMFFTILLFIYSILENKSKWITGFFLLLMFDAKEYAFFSIGFAYGVFIIVWQLFLSNGKNLYEKIKLLFMDLFKLYIFPLVFICLMVFTSYVPVNMFFFSITGLVENGQEWNKAQFSAENATINMLDGTEKNIPSLSSLSVVEYIKNTEIKEENIKSIFTKLVDFGDLVISYIGKILYPRTFSFISVPKIVILPFLIYIFKEFFYFWKEKDRKNILFSLTAIIYLLVFLLRTSHGRYLLPITPIIFIYFVNFFFKNNGKYISFMNCLLITIFVLLGLYFEVSYVSIKIVMEAILLVILWTIYFSRKYRVNSYIKYLFILLVAISTFGTSLVYSYKIGQISMYAKWGKYFEYDIITSYAKEDEVIWVNDTGQRNLVSFFRKDTYIEPEWYWILDDSVPKKYLLKKYKDQKTYFFDFVDMKDFKSRVNGCSIEKVFLVQNELESNYFEKKYNVEDFKSQSWLELEDEIQLKNKVLYIFNVKN